jgi:transcriptional regulator NrdR family protein
MKCPKCKAKTKVNASKEIEDNQYRRRVCACGEVIYTREEIISKTLYGSALSSAYKPRAVR